MNSRLDTLVPGPPDTEPPALRKRAIERLQEQAKASDARTLAAGAAGQDLTHLVEELRIYQAELEVQNDELRGAQTRTDRLLQRFSALFRQAPVCMVLVDRFGVILDANEHATLSLGLGHQRQRHHLFYRSVAEGSRHKMESAFLRAGDERQAMAAKQATDVEMIDSMGNVLIGDLSVLRMPESEPGQEREFLCIFTDHSTLTRYARELQEQQSSLRLFSKAFEQISDAVLVTDLEGTILSVNRAFTRITGYTEAQVMGRNPRMLASGHTDPAVYEAMWESLREVGHWEGELSNRRPDGSIYPEWISIDTLLDEKDQPLRYVSIFHDLTQTRAQEETLRRLANEDSLTGLPNRNIMLTLVQQAFERARRTGTKVGIMFLDLDNFKNINDSLGHFAGDQTLIQCAQRMRQRLRDTDTLLRMGGDEFLIIAEHLHTAGDANRVAQSLLETAKTPIELGTGQQIFVTFSIGICLYPDDGIKPEQLLQEADTAMYRAKSIGRNRVEFYSPALMERVQEELSIANDMRFALKRDELRVEFQPVVPTRADLPMELEALVRWQHPSRGLLYPDSFIPITERSGLIHDLSLVVLEKSCAALRRLLDAGAAIGSVAVNVSFRDIDLPDLPDQISQLLAAHRLTGNQLKLELTESDIMRHPQESLQTLERIRAMGVRIAVDDFGTGFSSLAYLRTLPLDTLKIDRSFVNSLLVDDNSQSIVTMIVSLAKSCGYNIVAEGVETQEQSDALRALGVEYLQGWLYARSVPEERLIEVLAALPRLN
ncbi:MAG: EAL domain-containing protein [Hylemonella sp.]|nr:EAL domain-containing protein [Hylemonella sp.]